MKSSRTAIMILVVSALTTSCGRDSHTFEIHPSDIFQNPKAVAFCTAAMRGDMREVDALLDSGLDTHQQGKHGMDLLIWSLGCKNTGVFERLLKRGADPNRRLPNGDSAMALAARMDSASYLELALRNGGHPNLVDPSTGRSLLDEALMHNQYTNIQVLVTHGANVNLATARGNTTAMTAARLNRYDIVLYLFQNGADPRSTLHAGIGVTDYLRLDLANPHLLRHGKLWDAKLKLVDLLEARGIDVTELRRLIATPPAKDKEPLIREYRSW